MNKLRCMYAAMAILMISCTEDPVQNEENSLRTEETCPTNVLQFSSTEELASTISELKETGNFDIKSLARTRAVASAENFISLRQHLCEQGLREFTDAELAEIIRDSLEYEPEDSLIVDPYMTAVLNEDREVQVGTKICRFVNEGMVAYEADDRKPELAPELIEAQVRTNTLTHGQSVKIVDSKGVSAEFVKIDYARRTTVIDDIGNEPNDNVTYNYDGSITLTNGVRIPANMICRTTYRKGGGNGSWLAKGVSGLFGKNVTITNNYDKKHRMKLRMYEQDYIIYRAVGMTVRMQARKLGIWWRKKAQEFRYGWSAIECEYNFPKPTFQDPPKMPNGQPQYAKYPTGMTKKFPFANSEIVLFHMPLAEYDITTGDVNKAMSIGMKKLTSAIQSWFNKSENKGLSKNPRGLFTTRDEDKKIVVIFPQGEEVDYRTGREVVRWDKQWFSGNFTLGFGSNLAGGGFHYKKVSFSPSKDVSIIRGRVYGAVKYNDQWRACVIETN